MLDFLYLLSIVASFLGGFVILIKLQLAGPAVYCFVLGFLLYLGMRDERGARFMLLMFGVTAPLCGIYLMWEERSLSLWISETVLMRSELSLIVIGVILLAGSRLTPSPEDREKLSQTIKF